MMLHKLNEKEELYADYCPDQLTLHLIRRLKMVLSEGRYANYLDQVCENRIKHVLTIEGQLEFSCDEMADINRIKAIRQATKTWNKLELVYRLTVLDAFATLFYERLQNYSAVERTVIFCRIFIQDLVDVLTSE